MFSGEMDEHAPVQLGVVRPTLLGTQRTLAPSPLQDLSDGLFAVPPGKKFAGKIQNKVLENLT